MINCNYFQSINQSKCKNTKVYSYPPVTKNFENLKKIQKNHIIMLYEIL